MPPRSTNGKAEEQHNNIGRGSHTKRDHARGYSRALGLGLAVRNRAPSSHLAVCNRALPLDLAVRNRAPSFFIGATSDVWGFLIVFSILANERCCTKPTEKHTQAPSRTPLRRGKHAAPGGYISTATMVTEYGYLVLLWVVQVGGCLATG